MIIDWIVRFLDERLDAEKAEAAKKDKVHEAPPVAPSLADAPPRPRSQPLQETPAASAREAGGLSMKAERFLADMVEPSPGRLSFL